MYEWVLKWLLLAGTKEIHQHATTKNVEVAAAAADEEEEEAEATLSL